MIELMCQYYSVKWDFWFNHLYYIPIVRIYSLAWIKTSCVRPEEKKIFKHYTNTSTNYVTVACKTIQPLLYSISKTKF
jgi:hypothetical protein